MKKRIAIEILIVEQNTMRKERIFKKNRSLLL